MLLQDKFVKRKKFKREGVLKTFILPTDSVKVLGDKKYSVKIDEKTKSLKCVGGKYPYVITDSIGKSGCHLVPPILTGMPRTFPAV